MDIELLRKLADDVALSLGFKVYLVEMRKGEDEDELYVEIDRPGFIDMDGIVSFSQAYSIELDKIEDQLDSNYVLNCCSADPEREITYEDYSDYLESFVEVVCDDGDFLGELVKNADDSITLKTNNKGRIKLIDLEKARIKKINLRIKI